MPEDGLLKNAFAELRRAETSSAPRFRVIGQRSAAVLHWSNLAAAMLALFVVITFSVLVQQGPVVTEVPMKNWKAPTDFLLQTPQAGLLRDVPQFGERNVTQ